MKTITAFQTSDGKIFESQTAASAHEFSRQYDAQIMEFFKDYSSYRRNTPPGAMVHKSIIEWEHYKLVKGSQA